MWFGFGCAHSLGFCLIRLWVCLVSAMCRLIMYCLSWDSWVVHGVFGDYVCCGLVMARMVGVSEYVVYVLGVSTGVSM